MTLFKYAPMIVHIGDRIKEDAPAHIAIACKNMHTTKSACKLLTFYCDCKEGFRPSLSFIYDKTGIIKDHVSRYRTELIRKGFIAYDKKHIFVSWDRIRMFCMVDRRMTKTKNYKTSPIKMSYDEHYIDCSYEPDPYKRFMKGYIAVAQAKKDGIVFPEESKIGIHNYNREEETSSHDSLDSHSKIGIHNYNSESVASADSIDWFFGNEILNEQGIIIGYNKNKVNKTTKEQEILLNKNVFKNNNIENRINLFNNSLKNIEIYDWKYVPEWAKDVKENTAF